ncbi:ArsR/SmtB family transcription factor [Allonocardiopsis opalescens]|nr:metalloregulator ArsR/SmtB family transcription factor [Allonocardiopsis opalescens]
MAASVFEALADPVRRRLLELVAERERTAGELAAEFAISRPAVSRHLRVLAEAGLVGWRGEAQRRLYRLEPGPLAEAGAWIERTRDSWAGRLDAMERHLDDTWREQPDDR